MLISEEGNGKTQLKPDQESSESAGWFSRFTKRYNFYNIKITRDAASADYIG